MKILIADDEALARGRLKALLNELGNHQVVAEAANGREALEMCRAYQPEVLLLDIGMPGLNGMEAARHLDELARPPVLVFTTAYGEYALEAFEHQAVDYLLKPVRKDRLKQALNRAAALLADRRVHENGETGRGETEEANTARTHISTTHLNTLRLIPVKQIYYCKAEQKYVTLRWTHGEALTDEPLVSLEKEFAGQFLRIHRNALVALVHVAGLVRSVNGGYLITFQDIPDQLDVSRRHLGNVRKVLKDIRLLEA